MMARDQPDAYQSQIDKGWVTTDDFMVELFASATDKGNNTTTKKLGDYTIGKSCVG